MDWEFDPLWTKARLFVARALAEERGSSLFAFWAVLAMESLCRATLARVHPALLADPRDGANILYAFGFRTNDKPISIPMTTVLKRLQVVVEEFTSKESQVVDALVRRRNAELHSGHVAFEDFPTELWLAGYYGVADIIVRHLGMTLDDLLGPEEGEAARLMIASKSDELRGEVGSAIAAAEKILDSLTDEQLIERTAPGEFLEYLLAPNLIADDVECPVCHQAARVVGQRIRLLEPRVEEEMIVRSVVALPIELVCRVCELDLKSHGALDLAGRGGQFTVDEYFDPVDFYGIELDPADYYEYDYGND